MDSPRHYPSETVRLSYSTSASGTALRKWPDLVGFAIYSIIAALKRPWFLG